MLRATRRLLRNGGRTAFLTIHPAPGLSGARYRRALRAGPRAVGSRRRELPALLRAAGFSEVELDDVTAEYRETLRRWIVETERHEPSLRSLLGAEEVGRSLTDRRAALAAVDDGLLRRSLLVGRRTDGPSPYSRAARSESTRASRSAART